MHAGLVKSPLDPQVSMLSGIEHVRAGGCLQCAQGADKSTMTRDQIHAQSNASTCQANVDPNYAISPVNS